MKFRSILSILLFTSVALGSFSVWAWGGQWFTSEPAMYSACASVFLGLGGAALLPSTNTARAGRLKFCLTFAGAFTIYAVIWSVAWFSLPNTFGEILGSSLGLLAFTAAMKAALKFKIRLMTGVAVIFLWHSLGYYTGEFAYSSLQGKAPPGSRWKALPRQSV